MKMKLTFEGDYFEDGEEIEIILASKEHICVILKAKEFIRSKIKWDESLTEESEAMLRELDKLLHINENFY